MGEGGGELGDAALEGGEGEVQAVVVDGLLGAVQEGEKRVDFAGVSGAGLARA